MDMPGPSAPSDKSLEEKLCQCVENIEKKEVRISFVPLVPFESPNRGNEASLNHSRNAPRVTSDKIGVKQGAVSKHRHTRYTSKGDTKVISVDQDNFKEFVKEHTSPLSSASSSDVAAQPTSPLTPHSATSTPYTRGFKSQPSSPSTPHSIPSNFRASVKEPTSQHSSGAPPVVAAQLPRGFLSPHSSFFFQGHAEHTPPLNTHLYVPNPPKVHAEPGPHLNKHLGAPNPFGVHAENSPQLNTHRSVPNLHPLSWGANPSLSPSIHANLHQSTAVPRCASTPCLGVANQADNVPSDNGRPQCTSPAELDRLHSLDRFLMDDGFLMDDDALIVQSVCSGFDMMAECWTDSGP